MLLLLVACADATAPAAPRWVTDEVAGLEVATDAAATYRYRPAAADADSLLVALWRAGVRVAEAWQPLEDLCADPVGPRFTIRLEAADPRVLALDFETGSGIRPCTVRVRRYRPAP